MAELEVTLSDRLDSEIDRLVEQGDFLNREQAIEELLSMGVSAYDTDEEDDPLEPDEEMFTQAVNERKDPAMDDEPGDDYSF
jgi:Arc/MetJ-type ribon-helix-helix transcriptional regulator